MSSLGETQFYTCAGCGRKVDHLHPATIVARRQIHFNDGAPSIDGLGLLFHPGCWFGDTRDIRRRAWEDGPK